MAGAQYIDSKLNTLFVWECADNCTKCVTVFLFLLVLRVSLEMGIPKNDYIDTAIENIFKRLILKRCTSPSAGRHSSQQCFTTVPAPVSVGHLAY